ncbi:DNA-binding CsgD family transcriptional regulator [Sphingomonas sp. F9_3S_D5_B_2]
MPAFDPEVLSDREKAVLRLLAQGHDAKSTARELGISVHAVNERLRSARRKLGVSSSRTAARLLVSSKGPGSDSLVHKKIGLAVPQPTDEAESQDRKGDKHTLALAVGGVCTMLLAVIIAVVATRFAPTDPSGPLPNWSLQKTLPEVAARQSNRIHLSGNRLTWNGEEVSEANVRTYLGVVTQMNPQPLTILSYGSQVAPGRVARTRELIDGVLHCKSATCLEVTKPVDDGGAAPSSSEAR